MKEESTSLEPGGAAYDLATQAGGARGQRWVGGGPRTSQGLFLR